MNNLLRNKYSTKHPNNTIPIPNRVVVQWISVDQWPMEVSLVRRWLNFHIFWVVMKQNDMQQDSIHCIIHYIFPRYIECAKKKQFVTPTSTRKGNLRPLCRCHIAPLLLLIRTQVGCQWGCSNMTMNYVVVDVLMREPSPCWSYREYHNGALWHDVPLCNPGAIPWEITQLCHIRGEILSLRITLINSFTFPFMILYSILTLHTSRIYAYCPLYLKSHSMWSKSVFW